MTKLSEMFKESEPVKEAPPMAPKPVKTGPPKRFSPPQKPKIEIEEKYEIDIMQIATDFVTGTDFLRGFIKAIQKAIPEHKFPTKMLRTQKDVMINQMNQGLSEINQGAKIVNIVQGSKGSMKTLLKDPEFLEKLAKRRESIEE